MLLGADVGVLCSILFSVENQPKMVHLRAFSIFIFVLSCFVILLCAINQFLTWIRAASWDSFSSKWWKTVAKLRTENFFLFTFTFEHFWANTAAFLNHGERTSSAAFLFCSATNGTKFADKNIWNHVRQAIRDLRNEVRKDLCNFHCCVHSETFKRIPFAFGTFKKLTRTMRIPFSLRRKQTPFSSILKSFPHQTRQQIQFLGYLATVCCSVVSL